MDFEKPHRLLGSSLDSDALIALASTDTGMTGRRVAQQIGKSPQGVLNSLDRLVGHGIVISSPAGRAKLYTFNHDHVAAPWIEGLSGLRQQLLDRIRSQIGNWSVPPVAAAIFGSVAHETAGPASDLDIFLVRPTSADQDSWESQVYDLTLAISRWTGNDARRLEFEENEIASAINLEPVVRDVLDQGIEVGGSLARLRKLARP